MNETVLWAITWTYGKKAWILRGPVTNFLFLFHVENNFKGGDVLHVTATILSASGMRGTYSLSNLVSQQPCKGVYPTYCRYDKTEDQR